MCYTVLAAVASQTAETLAVTCELPITCSESLSPVAHPFPFLAVVQACPSSPLKEDWIKCALSNIYFKINVKWLYFESHHCYRVFVQ